MFTQAELAVLRRAYARQVTFLGNVRNANLERAYAEVPREAYLGPGPWPILRWPSYPPRPGYTPTPDADPAWLYADTLIGIVPERGYRWAPAERDFVFLVPLDVVQPGLLRRRV